MVEPESPDDQKTNRKSCAYEANQRHCPLAVHAVVHHVFRRRATDDSPNDT
jgi:hypothetical protein